MTKTKLFEEIVAIMQTDASCCKDEHGANPEYYRAKISDTMNDEEFLLVVNSYLATFHVIFHVCLEMANRGILPFTVQRYQDILYVCNTQPHSPLSIGDKIISVNGLSVQEFSCLHEDMLYGEPEERQSEAWGLLLCYAKTVTVRKADTGEMETYPIMLDGIWRNGVRYTCKKLQDDITYLQLKDFQDETTIHQLYAQNEAALKNCEYLIIDVRENAGGTNTAFFPLLQLCLPEGKGLKDVQDSIYGGDIEINYSEKSCDSRLKMYTEALKQELPEETRAIVQSLIDETLKNRGKGFVTLSSDDSILPTIGLAKPRKVYIITDQRCGSSGDAFVDIMGRSDKVTVVGRPTLGILDYSNVTTIAYDKFYLTYPTSRSLYLDKGVQMRNRGVPVDIYIPWTLEHLVRDVDLCHVLELIQQEKALDND